MIQEHEHAELIRRLGGTAVVAQELRLEQNTVSNWLRRGVPWKHRYAVYQLARRRRIALPDGFMAAASGEAA